MEFVLPTLRIVPTAHLVPHEHADESRTHPLVARIRAAGVFRDPPVVMPFPQDTSRYMVLDGANRTTACRLMGLPHTLVQVVEPGAASVEVYAWNHVVWGLSAEALRHEVETALGRELKPIAYDEGEARLTAQEASLLLATPDGRYWWTPRRNRDLVAWLQELAWVVEAYLRRGHADRTGLRRVDAVQQAYPRWAGLVLFPRFRAEQVLEVAWQGYKFPAGLTRFKITPRALRLHYPLDELAADRPLDEKNRRLQAWLAERLQAKAVRYYAEPTVLFDE